MTIWNQFCRAIGLTGLAPATTLFNGEAYGGWTRDTTRRVDIVSGCLLAIDTKLWRQLDGFDCRYFMYGEDADLCLRAAALGAQPMITPDAEIVHYGGASERTRAGKMIKLLTAKATLIDRHWPSNARTIGKSLLQAWPLSRWIAYSFLASMKQGNTTRDARDVWREIWATRRTWRQGYETTTHGATQTTKHPSPANPATA